jgi:signal transduction histidine kinase
MPVEELRNTAKSVKPRWIWRALGLSIPLHLTVFSLLYFGGRALLESEMIDAHERNSQLLLMAAVNSLHLAMGDDARDAVRRRLAELVAAQEETNLHLWSASGGSGLPGSGLPGSGHPEHIAGKDLDSLPREIMARDVEEFLKTSEDQRFWLDRSGDGEPYLRGLVRIRADVSCRPCHDPGETRGVASMTRELGRELGGLRRRLLLFVGIGAVVWVLLAAVLHRITTRAFERSAARVRADLDDAGDGATTSSPSAATQILDPMSTALFESLRRSLKDQRRREEHFATRLHYADRLASLGRLAAGLAHEIKNPLAGVQGALEILRDEVEDDSTLEVYAQMLAELGRVDGTIRALLRFARPAPSHRRPTDVSGLLEDTVKLLRSGLARRGVALEVETAPGVGSFPLDAEQIRQALVNLVTNAAEALEQEPGVEGGRIVLRATRFPEDGSLLLAVADDGPGIPEEDHEQIFQPFFTSKFSGTGLGLAVADSLVTRHGGRIELESESGEGSTFFVILPLPEGDEGAGEEQET